MKDILLELTGIPSMLPREVEHAVLPDSTARTTSRSREVYKDKKTKRHKDSSRSSEEEMELLPSASSGREQPGDQDSQGLVVPQEVGVSGSAAQDPHQITGISVQHKQSKNGVKIGITFQTFSMQHTGENIMVTAELKRRDRIRDLKVYEYDDPVFSDMFMTAIQEIKDLGTDAGKDFCIGRCHERGQRSEWIPNLYVVASVPNGVAQQVFINYLGQEFIIDMTADMSIEQSRYYHSNGIYGSIKKTGKPKSLLELPRSQL